MDRKFVDFSWHSLDFYYNYRLLLAAKRLSNFEQIKTCVLCLPYYIFNHDMSREIHPWEVAHPQIFSISGLDDYHNYFKMPDASRHAACNDIVNFKIWGERFLEYYSYSENIYIAESIGEADYREELGSIWTKFHWETISENKAIFGNIMDELQDSGIKPIIIIPPFYLDAFSDEDRDAIGQAREFFYNIVREYEDIDVYDCLSEFRCADLYSDATHLNYYGAREFTERINRLLRAG